MFFEYVKMQKVAWGCVCDQIHSKDGNSISFAHLWLHSTSNQKHPEML